jgi:hypothetical protein
MTVQRKPKSSTDKMRTYRTRLRAAGLRPVQIWVPDVRAPNFIEEARRQSLRASMHPSEREALDVIEAVSDLDDDAS